MTFARRSKAKIGPRFCTTVSGDFDQLLAADETESARGGCDSDAEAPIEREDVLFYAVRKDHSVVVHPQRDCKRHCRKLAARNDVAVATLGEGGRTKKSTALLRKGWEGGMRRLND